MSKDISQKDTIKKSRGSFWRTKWTVTVLQFLVLYIFWILLSGRLQTKYLVIGFFAALLVTYLTGDMLYNPRTKGVLTGSGKLLASIFRFAAYVIWIVWAILKANIQIALIILNPRLPIDPGFCRFSTRLKGQMTRVSLANSITLTPGTIAADMSRHQLLIHFLIPESMTDLVTGMMQNKVGSVFRENRDIPANIRWAHSIEELTRE